MPPCGLLSLLACLVLPRLPLLILIACAPSVLAVITPGQSPPVSPAAQAVDNFGSITCVGNKYPLDLPLVAGFNPNELTMQQFCAKPQFGGGRPGQNIGGWCSTFSSDPTLWMVAFDISAEGEANTVLQNPRTMLACSYRCFCNRGLPENAAQPRAVRKPREAVADQAYEILIDSVDDFDEPWIQNIGPVILEDPSTNVIMPLPKNGGDDQQIWDSARVATRDYNGIASHFNHDGNPRYVDTIMALGNYIVCHGGLPNFPMPGPYSWSDFNSMQALCSVQFFGGNPDANAGGYCHRSDDDVDDHSREATVWFSDEFTPRLDWTWGGGNFRFSATVRIWCRAHCVCVNEQAREDITKFEVGVVVWLIATSPNLFLVLHLDGSMTLDGPDTEESVTESTIMQILPPQFPVSRLSPTNSAGTCGFDGKQFCPIPWPVDILGPIPQTPPNTTQVIKSPNSHNFTECGMYCNGPQECGSGDSNADCFCGLPSPEDARTLGLSVFAPVPVCLVLAHVAASSLGGRGILQYIDERGASYQCSCNSTYISNDCCGSKDGVI